jgi:FdrA protein
MAVKDLFSKKLVVVNIGLEVFAKTMKEQNVKTSHVAWKPPAGGDKKLAALLEKVR